MSHLESALQQHDTTYTSYLSSQHILKTIVQIYCRCPCSLVVALGRSISRSWVIIKLLHSVHTLLIGSSLDDSGTDTLPQKILFQISLPSLFFLLFEYGPYLLYVSDRRCPRDWEEAVARIIGAVLRFVRSWSQILQRSRSRSRIQRGAAFDRSVQEFDTDRSVTYLSDPLLPIPPCWVELIRLEYVALMLQCATVMMLMLNTVLRSFEFIATSTSTIRTWIQYRLSDDIISFRPHVSRMTLKGIA